MPQSEQLMQTTPPHHRESQSTLTNVSELVLVSTVDELMPVSTPTVTAQSRVVQRSDDAPNHPQLKHKKLEVEDPPRYSSQCSQIALEELGIRERERVWQ